MPAKRAIVIGDGLTIASIQPRTMPPSIEVAIVRPHRGERRRSITTTVVLDRRDVAELRDACDRFLATGML